MGRAVLLETGASRGSPRLARLLSTGLVGTFTAYATLVVIGDPEVLHETPIPHVLFNLPFLLASLASVRAARRGGSTAPAWWAVAASTGLYLAANLVAVLFVPDGEYPSIADVLWLASYACAAIALVLLARSSISGVTLPAALDGAIAGMVATALATTIVVGRLLEHTDGDTAVVVTNLAYPVADLLLLGLLAATTKLVALVDPVRVLLVVGFLLLFIGDCVFLWGTSQGSWAPQTLPETLFVGAATCVGLAATIAQPHAPLPAATPHLMVPAAGAAFCIVLLVVGQVTHPGPVALALTVAAALLVGVRVWLGVRTLRRRAADVEASPARLALVAEARDGLLASQIVAYYQPQVDLRTGDVIGAELLARWEHPSRGLIGPDEFLPLLAEGSLMARLTEAMLGHASRARTVCASRGHTMGLSVNLSTPELADPELLTTVEALADATPEGVGAVTLEITEESVLSDPSAAEAVLTELRRHGVRISVDDYGTGHSSLAYLRDLPLDEVKLDRSFVRGAWVDERSAAIAASTVDLAHELDLSIVAEGIEDEQTNAWLRSLGCDVGQGYFHARPMPLHEFVVWLDDRRAVVS